MLDPPGVKWADRSKPIAWDGTKTPNAMESRKMLRKFLSLSAAICILGGVAFAAEVAKELKSGLEEGASVEAYYVKKCGGAVEDGVKEGEELCYRCKLGARPVVNVFSRSIDDELAALIKKLDKAMVEHKDHKFASFVNLLGEDAEKLAEKGHEFAEKNKIENVALVVPVDTKTGPEAYSINPEADLTVIVYNEGKVVASHAFEDGKLDEKAIDSVMKEAEKMLN